MKHLLITILLLAFPSLGIAEQSYKLKINTKNIISLYADLSAQDFQYIISQQNNANEIKLGSCRRFGEILSVEQSETKVYLICYDSVDFFLFTGNYKIDQSLIKRYGNRERVIERYPIIDHETKIYRIKIYNILEKYFIDHIDLIDAYMRHFNLECLSYEPSVVSLSGRLERRTYPGPPNYEDISKGDKAETSFYIVLDNPICVKGDESSPTYYPQEDVVLVQLVLNEHDYEKFRPFLNKSVKVRGKLFGAHTGHHHAPLLLTM